MESDAGYSLTVNNFIIGPHNREAWKRVRKTVESPGKRYNPLVIYGPVGSGKTHLLRAAKQYLYQQSPQLQVMYRSSERFILEFIDVIKSDPHHWHRRLYSHGVDEIIVQPSWNPMDVLLLDDLELIAGKECLKQDFRYLCRKFCQEGKQLIITITGKSHSTYLLAKHLITGFETGILLEIEHPNLESRVAILKKKANSRQFQLSDNVLRRIAARETNDIRKLEGIIMKLETYID